MRRHLFNLLAGMSLLLGLAAVALWCRSTGTEDQWRWERHEAGAWKSVIIDSRQGKIAVTLGHVTYSGSADPAPLRLEFTHDATSLAGQDRGTTAAPATCLGFGFANTSPSAPPGEVYRTYLVRFPDWLMLLPAVLVALRWVWKYRTCRI